MLHLVQVLNIIQSFFFPNGGAKLSQVAGVHTFPSPLTLLLLVMLAGSSSVSEGFDSSTTSDLCFLAPEGAYPSTLPSLSPSTTC
jgi:hypothetical protein